MNTEKHNSIKQIILDNIAKGRIVMKPRWRFVLQAGLWILGVVVLTLAILFLTSFVVFVLRQSGAWFAPVFGMRGVGVFLTALPWVLVLASVLFVVILEVLVRRYAFAYRRPLLFSLGIILIIVAGGSILMSQLHLHRGVFRMVHDGRLPAAALLYMKFGMPEPEWVHPGTVRTVTADGFRMDDPRGESVRVFITSRTRSPRGLDIATGDGVVVLGRQDQDRIDAAGIMPLPEPPLQWNRDNRAMPQHYMPFPSDDMK